MNGNEGYSGAGPRPCAGPDCGNRLDGRRRDAEYCSDACRAAAWRKTKRSELAKLEEETLQLVATMFAKARAAFGLDEET